MWREVCKCVGVWVCGCVGVGVRVGREMGVRFVYVCNMHILPPKHKHRSYFTHTHTNAHKVVNQTVHSPLRNDPCYHPLSHSRTSQTSPSVPPTIAVEQQVHNNQWFHNGRGTTAMGHREYS